jgi:MFS family permease
MYSDDDLRSAVAAGVITDKDANALRDYVERQRSTQFQDEEHFRLVSGFNDIFVVIAAVLALAALWTLGNLVAPWLGGGAVAVASWLLAEYFTRKRRMALPSIVLLFACLGGVFAGVFLSLMEPWQESALVPLLAFLPTTVVACAHWFRFRVPITLAAGAATTVGLLISALAWAFAFSDSLLKITLFVAGLTVFSLALYWDRSDLERQTRRADVAFWLHLLAAPLLVHPIFVTLAGDDMNVGLSQAFITIAVYIILAGISLVIDRRALMVSALSYVIYVFSALLNSYGLVSVSTALIGLIVGSGLLLLAVFWHPLRSALVKALPQRFAAGVPATR